MAIERKSGIAVWRQIADDIRTKVSSGEMVREGKLPPEKQLAESFGVNRHTVRSAISALTQEGLLRAEQGRGTFVQKAKKLQYPISSRTRFSAGLEGQASALEMHVFEHIEEPASTFVAESLNLDTHAKVLRVVTVQEADDTAISVSTSWFDAERFDDIGERIEKARSISKALETYGVSDYSRKHTDVEARHGSKDVVDLLGLASGAIVLITRSTNCDVNDRPIQHSQTHFAADRVTLNLSSR